MTNTYRALGSVPVPNVELGDLFEHEFSAELEQDLLAAGRVEIVPRVYRVVGSSRVLDVDPDGELVAALTVGHEAQLVAGGHIVRADLKAAKAKGKTKGVTPTDNDETKE